MDKAVNDGSDRGERPVRGEGPYRDEASARGEGPYRGEASARGDGVWSGSWVAERLGVALVGDDTLTDLLGLALRRNPKRAHLLVSNVLGKHVPQSPSVVYGAGFTLGRRVRDLLGAAGARTAVVLGYAETATGLGHAVADGLGDAPYLHSTRRPVPGAARAGGFEESHSHATSHLLLPEDPALLAGDGPLVLVDDEFSTGNTVLNTIRALHERFPRDRYVVVALVDLRSAADQGRLTDFAAGTGARIDLVAAARGTLRLPAGVLENGQALVAAHERAAAGDPARGERGAPSGAGDGRIARVDLSWPAGVPDGGRHGFTAAHRRRLEAALPAMGARLAGALPPGARRVLVLGCEELMYAPLRLARELERLVPAADVRFSTTTRSPVLAVDDPGYAIRTRLVFPAHDDPADGPGERYTYNVAGGDFDAVLAVVDSTADTPRPARPPAASSPGSRSTPRTSCSPSSRRTSPRLRPPVKGPPCCPSPSAAPPSPVTRPTRSAGCSRTCRTSPWRRRPRNARRRSSAAARTTPSRCRSSTSPASGTRHCSTRRWRSPRPASRTPSGS
ncbi:hypothetical protein GCM10020295_58680 [Streptomyces cinereospinus]